MKHPLVLIKAVGNFLAAHLAIFAVNINVGLGNVDVLPVKVGENFATIFVRTRVRIRRASPPTENKFCRFFIKIRHKGLKIFDCIRLSNLKKLRSWWWSSGQRS